MQLLKGLLLVAVFTLPCWISVLALSRRIRQTGLVGPGLDVLFDQAERYAWAIGIFLALLVVDLLAGMGMPFLAPAR
jgi:hypothetical protein